MSQLMRKVAGYHLIPIHAAPDLCDRRMTGIDQYGSVIGAGTVTVLRIPVDIDMNPTIIPISFGLGCSHIFKMTCQDPGGEKLPVRDLTAVFVQKLSDPLMIYFCHKSLLSQEALRRFGAKIGSRIVVFSASLSSSSDVALLITVLSADL